MSDYNYIYYLYFVIELYINVTCNSSTVEAFSRSIFPTKNTVLLAYSLSPSSRLSQIKGCCFSGGTKPLQRGFPAISLWISARREKLSAFTFYESASTAPEFTAIPDDCETRQFFACSQSKKPLQSEVSETNERDTECGWCEASLATQQQLHFKVEANVLRYSL